MLECIERNSFFKIREQFNVFYFQFVTEKNDRLKLCENSETLRYSLLPEGSALLGKLDTS